MRMREVLLLEATDYTSNTVITEYYRCPIPWLVIGRSRLLKWLGPNASAAFTQVQLCFAMLDSGPILA